MVKAITESRRRGEFTFNEMELYAAKGIDKISTLAELIQMRFPVIFIDEAQDTKKEIWELLNKIYEKAIYNSFIRHTVIVIKQFIIPMKKWRMSNIFQEQMYYGCLTVKDLEQK